MGRVIVEPVTLAHPVAAEATSLPPVAMVVVRALTAGEEVELEGQPYSTRLLRETGLSVGQQRALHPHDLRAVIAALTRVKCRTRQENDQ